MSEALRAWDIHGSGRWFAAKGALDRALTRLRDQPGASIVDKRRLTRDVNEAAQQMVDSLSELIAIAEWEHMDSTPAMRLQDVVRVELRHLNPRLSRRFNREFEETERLILRLRYQWAAARKRAWEQTQRQLETNGPSERAEDEAKLEAQSPHLPALGREAAPSPSRDATTGPSAKLTGKVAANLIGVSPSTFSRWRTNIPAWATRQVQLFKHLIDRKAGHFDRKNILKLAVWFRAAESNGGQKPTDCP